MGTTLAERAIFYSKRGFAIFPLCTVEGDRCSCGKAVWRGEGRPDAPHRYCQSAGKHPVWPLAPHGVLDATTDPQLIREWWAVYPDANVGIATGDVSQLVVIDVDSGHGGEQTVANLEQRHGRLPDTWAVETGGGGFHLYFRMPLVQVRNSAGAIGPGVDVRGSGGYVVAPPSRHASGASYRWSASLHPQKVALADLPEWLLNRLAPGGHAASAGSGPIPRTIVEGQRNSLLASAAGTMRRRGFCEEAILAALVIENKRRCQPPLDRQEIERIAKSIERYPPAPTISGGERWAVTG